MKKLIETVLTDSEVLMNLYVTAYIGLPTLCEDEIQIFYIPSWLNLAWERGLRGLCCVCVCVVLCCLNMALRFCDCG